MRVGRPVTIGRRISADASDSCCDRLRTATVHFGTTCRRSTVSGAALRVKIRQAPEQKRPHRDPNEHAGEVFGGRVFGLFRRFVWIHGRFVG